MWVGCEICDRSQIEGRIQVAGSGQALRFGHQGGHGKNSGAFTHWLWGFFSPRFPYPWNGMMPLISRHCCKDVICPTGGLLQGKFSVKGSCGFHYIWRQYWQVKGKSSFIQKSCTDFLFSARPWGHSGQQHSGLVSALVEPQPSHTALSSLINLLNYDTNDNWHLL